MAVLGGSISVRRYPILPHLAVAALGGSVLVKVLHHPTLPYRAVALLREGSVLVKVLHQPALPYLAAL